MRQIIIDEDEYNRLLEKEKLANESLHEINIRIRYLDFSPLYILNRENTDLSFSMEYSSEELPPKVKENLDIISTEIKKAVSSANRAMFRKVETYKNSGEYNISVLEDKLDKIPNWIKKIFI